MGKFKCEECGLEQDLPMHCEQPVHPKSEQLACWLGPDCGSQPIPEHHGKPMVLVLKISGL